MHGTHRLIASSHLKPGDIINIPAHYGTLRIWAHVDSVDAAKFAAGDCIIYYTDVDTGHRDHLFAGLDERWKAKR